MQKFSWSSVALGVLTSTLVGCGVIYTSPQVRDNDAAIANVEVVPFTLQSIAEANRTPFVPRSLPSAYSAIAHISGASSQLNLPTPPFGTSQPPREPEERLPPPLTPRPYEIGAGDRLRIVGPALVPQAEGFGSGNAAETFTVQSQGEIVLPDIGTLSVQGLTLPQANKALMDVLTSNRLDPNFAIEIVEFNARQVFVDGAVGNSVVVPVTFEPLLLQAALVAAGGAKVEEREFATVRILRDGQVFAVPLERLYGRGSPQILLADGDGIFVDSGYDLEAAQAFFRDAVERRQLTSDLRRNALSEIDAIANIQRGNLNERRDVFERRLELGAVTRDYVFIAGEVGVTQAVPIPFEQPIALSNVLFSDVTLPLETADLGHIYVIRIAADAQSVRAFHLNGTNAINLAFAAHFEMRPNDLVFVAQQRVTTWNRVLSQLSPTAILSAVNGGDLK